ncbi:MAG: hypothetical protein AB7F59_12125 [Bdellovibrionales bacterium]
MKLLSLFSVSLFLQLSTTMVMAATQRLVCVSDKDTVTIEIQNPEESLVGLTCLEGETNCLELSKRFKVTAKNAGTMKTYSVLKNSNNSNANIEVLVFNSSEVYYVMFTSSPFGKTGPLDASMKALAHEVEYYDVVCASELKN